MLPDICERYLLSYMQYFILKRDSNNDASEQSAEMEMREAEHFKTRLQARYDGRRCCSSRLSVLDIEGRL